MNKLLVVVDMQNDFIDGALGTPEARAIIPAVAEFIKNWDGNLFCTQDTHYDDYLETQEGKFLPVEHCIVDTEGWELNTEIDEAIEEHLNKYDEVRKDAFKFSFGSISLGTHCRFKEYDEIHFVGLCTGICVISNAVIAKTASPESSIYIHKNLCACVTPESHERALEQMALLQMNIVD